MAIQIPIISPGAPAELQWARIYAPDGSTAAEVAMAYSAPNGGFVAAAPVAIADGGPYTMETRKVTALNSTAFDASTTERLFPGTLGYVVSGVLVDDQLAVPNVSPQSPFEAEMAENLDDLYNEFGVGGSYVGPDGSSIDGLTLRVRRNDPHQVERTNRNIGELQSGTVMVRQSELAKPLRNGRFTVRGVEVWTIELTPILKNGELICACQRTGTESKMPRRADA